MAVDGIKRNLTAKKISFTSKIFQAKDLSVSSMSAVISSAAFSQIRLVIIKDCDCLSGDCKAFLLDNFERLIKNNCFIFQTAKEIYHLRNNKKYKSDGFFTLLVTRAAVSEIGAESREPSIEDFIADLRRGDLSSCMHCIEILLKDQTKAGVLGPQLMGILINHVAQRKKNNKNISRDWNYLWQADRMIKAEGIDSRLVIETLLPKLLG